VALPNQKFREIVFQLLYSRDMGESPSEAIIPMLMKELSVSKKTVLEASALVEKILARKEELDQKIATGSDTYTFDRIHTVERNILRLGLYEMLYADDIPEKVAISEAMRLAKKFSSGDARSFVNAVLDRILKDSEHA
jgi:N utilization substance protein B